MKEKPMDGIVIPAGTVGVSARHGHFTRVEGFDGTSIAYFVHRKDAEEYAEWAMKIGDIETRLVRLVAENERLRTALDLCRRVIGTGEPTSDYEARAERFYRVTHMMAPGKSEPLGFVSRYSYEQRRSAWESWAQQELAEARAALAREEAPHA
jgi:hypothetical protein